MKWNSIHSYTSSSSSSELLALFSLILRHRRPQALHSVRGPRGPHLRPGVSALWHMSHRQFGSRSCQRGFTRDSCRSFSGLDMNLTRARQLLQGDRGVIEAAHQFSSDEVVEGILGLVEMKR